MSQFTRRQALASAAVLAAPQLSNARPADPLKFGLGLVTYNLAAKWDLATILKICKDTKIAAIEFRTTHAHGVEPSLSADQRADVMKKCTDAGVAIWGCGSVCEFHSPDATVVKKHIEDCKRFVHLVADLKGRGVKVRPNGLPKDVPHEKTIEQIGKALVECGKAASDAGVEIWVEVHGPISQLPINMKAIMEQCGHPAVGVTWNSNPTDVVNGSVAKSFELLKPWIKSCHINELYKDADKKYPYRELFTLLKSIGYDRYTLIEVGKTPPDAESGAELIRYYRALWRELTA